MKRLIVLVVLLVSVGSVAGATSTYDVNVDAAVRATVLFVGDSNITYGGRQIAECSRRVRRLRADFLVTGRNRHSWLRAQHLQRLRRLGLLEDPLVAGPRG